MFVAACCCIAVWIGRIALLATVVRGPHLLDERRDPEYVGSGERRDVGVTRALVRS